jgi:GNAT superfamily N-acetyltransferase
MNEYEPDPETGLLKGVRLATPADELAVFELLMMLHAEMGFFTVSKQKVFAAIQWATEGRGGFIFCIDEDNRVVASLGMILTTDWYTDDEFLLERWNFVHPNYRRSDYGRRLLEQAKATSDWFTKSARKDGRNDVLFLCGINSFHRTEAKVRLYARHIPCIGAYFLYGEPPAQAQAKKYRQAQREIEQYRKRDGGPSENRLQVPLVETILRVGS